MKPFDPWRRVRVGVMLLVAVIGLGTGGYILLGLGVLDALYQTVTTLTTVGFREIGEVDGRYKVFTIALILVGVGTTLYTITVLIETLLEGHLDDRYRRRRMQHQIDELRGHVIVCGFGQVGGSITRVVRRAGRDVVVIDRDGEKAAEVEGPFIEGDATDDDVLRRAGLAHASTLVLAMDTDVDNVYVALSARSVRPDLFIVARASVASAEPKLRQAGADRVVNPHEIGGTRMASMFLQPNVVDFLDVVMHDRDLEVRLEEFELGRGSPLLSTPIRDVDVRERTGAVLLAVRVAGSGFCTSPPVEAALGAGDVLIALGTEEQLARLRSLATSFRGG